MSENLTVGVNLAKPRSYWAEGYFFGIPKLGVGKLYTLESILKNRKNLAKQGGYRVESYFVGLSKKLLGVGKFDSLKGQEVFICPKPQCL